jgi:hypothetical protein
MNRQMIRPWIFMIGLLAALAIGCSGATPGPAPAQPESARTALDGSSVGYDSEGDEPPNGEEQQAADDGTLVIHTGTLELEVADLTPAVDQATALVRSLGGNVAESHATNSGGMHSATVTYRIPAARWDEAVAGLRGIGQRVVTENIEAQDVTTQVIDLDARITNLRATEAALQGIMVDATTITDVLKVQAELTKIRSDIESMTAQRDHLADRAALGTLTVQFGGPVMAATAATEGWDLGREVDAALAALVKLGQGVASLGIWLLIVFLPVAIPVLAIFFVALWVRRRHATRHPVAAPLSE